jgi:translation initiation factor 1 (eIF-1/SUI1)
MVFANETTVGSINAPSVMIKVIARNGRKKITTIHGLLDQPGSELPPYIANEDQKPMTTILAKMCAATVRVIGSDGKVGQKRSRVRKQAETDGEQAKPMSGEKIIYIQGENNDKIIEYLVSVGIPDEKIKVSGVTD